MLYDSSAIGVARALALALAVMGTDAVAGQHRANPVQAIPSLDLERYAGRWHKVARLPNWFQDRCASVQLTGNATHRYLA